MSRSTYRLGTDEITAEKVFFFLVVVLIALLIPWFSINIESSTDREMALFFWILTITAMGIYIIDLTIHSTKFPILSEIIDTVSWDTSRAIVNFGRANVYVFVSLFFVVLLIVQSQQLLLVTAPTFQPVHLGATGKSILTGMAAIAEELFFVGCVAGIIFGIFMFLTRNPLIAGAAMLILEPLFFVFYHVARYGPENVPASIAVFALGFVSVLGMIIFRTLALGIAIHTANNIGITLFQQYSVDPTYIMFLWGFVLVGIYVIDTRIWRG